MRDYLHEYTQTSPELPAGLGARLDKQLQSNLELHARVEKLEASMSASELVCGCLSRIGMCYIFVRLPR